MIDLRAMILVRAVILVAMAGRTGPIAVNRITMACITMACINMARIYRTCMMMRGRVIDVMLLPAGPGDMGYSVAVAAGVI